MAENEDVGGGEPSAAEKEAQGLGWEPEDKWHGKAEDWVDADTFLRRGREINSVLKKTLKVRDGELASVKQQLAAMQGTVAELAEYRHNLEKTVYDRAMGDLKTQLKAARVDGDIERAADVEEAIDGLKEQAPKGKPATTTHTPPVEPPEFSAWKVRNPWYGEANPKMVAYADGMAIHVIQNIQRNERREPTSSEVLTAVDEAVREMFPQAFETRRASMVEGGSGAGSGSSSKSSKGFSSLPSDAKAQFEKFYTAGYYVDMKTRKPLPKAEAQAEYFKDYQ